MQIFIFAIEYSQWIICCTGKLPILLHYGEIIEIAGIYIFAFFMPHFDLIAEIIDTVAVFVIKRFDIDCYIKV